MTAIQAYQILNVRPGASWPEIEQAYRDALQKLQLQLVPGQPVAVRQKAQDQIAELKSAFEFLKNVGSPGAQPACAGGYAPPQAPRTAIPQLQPMPMPQIPPTAIPQVQPGQGLPIQPTGPAAIPLGLSPAAPSYPWVVPASFVLAAAVMLFVILLCVGSSASLSRKKTARLRVLSVPWSYVTVDGTLLGPSGQVEAFALKPGEYKLALCKGDTVLSRTLRLPKDCETIVEAQLEKGQINVTQK